MKGFCISLDVSKGSSFYQGFKGLDEPITKPKKIEHNLEGFKELLKLKEIKRNYKKGIWFRLYCNIWVNRCLS